MSKCKYEEYTEFRDACHALTNAQARDDYLAECSDLLLRALWEASYRLDEAKTEAERLGVTDEDMRHFAIAVDASTKDVHVELARSRVAELLR